MNYVKYGGEWRKEVMKNKKEVIVDMLRRVALERDRIEGAQQYVQAVNLLECPHGKTAPCEICCNVE